jgi:hypothetical protein
MPRGLNAAFGQTQRCGVHINIGALLAVVPPCPIRVARRGRADAISALLNKKFDYLHDRDKKAEAFAKTTVAEKDRVARGVREGRRDFACLLAYAPAKARYEPSVPLPAKMQGCR